MSNYKTQAAKDAAIAKQQEVVDNATPSASAEEKATLANIKSAEVVA
jgi:hypothetical protein